jgi:hypothetical protein
VSANSILPSTQWAGKRNSRMLIIVLNSTLTVPLLGSLGSIKISIIRTHATGGKSIFTSKNPQCLLVRLPEAQNKRPPSFHHLQISIHHFLAQGGLDGVLDLPSSIHQWNLLTLPPVAVVPKTLVGCLVCHRLHHQRHRFRCRLLHHIMLCCPLNLPILNLLS